MVARVTITLPEELLAQLDTIAEKDSLTRSDVVREAAGSYVAARASRAVDAERAEAVATGLRWLESIAKAPAPGEPSSLDLLRQTRGDEPDLGAPIESGES